MTGKTLFGAACAAMIMAAASVVPSAANADTSRQFLEKAFRGDISEVMLGKMAEKKGGNSMVQEFGRTLVDDHGKAKAQVFSVAQKLGISLPEKPIEKAMEEKDRLARLSGDQFDREFVRYMIVDHRHDISDFRKEIAKDDGAVSKLARDQLPTIEKHLDMAVSIAREPKVAEVETR
jgi:putative membrane protein